MFHIGIRQLMESSDARRHERSILIRGELDCTGTVQTDMGQERKGILSRATKVPANVRSNEWIIGQKTHEIRTDESLGIDM